MAEQQHSIVDQPATAAECARDYAAAQKDGEARKTDSANALAGIRSHGGHGPQRS